MYTNDERVALVTGANRGLGKETVPQLATRGLTVLLGSRDSRRGETAAGELAARGLAVTPVALDVTDPATAAAAAGVIGRAYGRLDVLVNNAGIQLDRPASRTTAVEMREIFGVNVFGLVTLVHTMLPLLAASPAPRIVNVTSTTASLELTTSGTDFGGDAEARLAYSSSKAAVNMLTVQYAKAFAADPDRCHIKVNAATPRLRRHRPTRHPQCRAGRADHRRTGHAR